MIKHLLLILLITSIVINIILQAELIELKQAIFNYNICIGELIPLD